jgi:hypothetical protein
MHLQRQQQQQQQQQQYSSPAKQAWGTAAPSGKLLPSLDSGSQVRRSHNRMQILLLAAVQ